MFVTAIIAAGGRGQRFGSAQPKQLAVIGGEPMLARSVRAFAAHPAVGEVIVALPDDLAADPPAYLRAPRVRVVAGGPRRQDSVANAFQAASASSDVIVIHDAARPFASDDLIARTIAAAAESGAAVAAVASRDTVKRAADPVEGADAAEARHYVLETIPRERVFLAQTPQAFRREILADALRLTGEATDEAALAERAGHAVRIVEGEATNIKITTQDDLVMAEALARKPARTGRAGTGYDLHRLVDGRPLILGGVAIPSDRGALGHSDADVVCHAITDAILGALSLGDIGRHFPDTDARWKDASSLDLLARAVAMAAECGYEIGNVDVTVVLEAPKIKGHIDAIRANLARTIGIDVARVSVKGKTNEGVDAVGRGEAIAAHAIALTRAR
ncbi:MAG TPA: 2-C-methyl-D-erythritol 4-phosphate cytidylyltransferase [Vicinamibacterales bacterium]|nr:2-C-methyl-D-erythritol 4-phosphate cytidylyltransferase [Vicinamibacterales bacterium]